MEFKVTTENGRVPVTVLHVDGNIDSASYSDFEAKAEELVEGGARHILVDLSNTSFVSSAGLRAIHNLFNKLNDLHPDMNLSNVGMQQGIANGTYKSPYLKLLNLSEEAKTAFTVSGFDMFIEAYTDLKTAIASF